MTCCGRKRDVQTEIIDKTIKNEKERRHRQIKLLLLGTGGSGKSTVAKQLKIIHKQGFSAQELEDFKAILHLNTVKSMQILIISCRKYSYELPTKFQKVCQFFEGLNPLTTPLTTNLAKKIKQLWEVVNIQRCYQEVKYSLPENALYCFDNIDRFGQEGFIPTLEDILHARQRTTGIMETVFELDKFTFTLIDVGGQRSERRKWLHCFQEITALLYCVALDEYDMTLIEDDSVNRMSEALIVFSEMINGPWFERSHVIMFLNKDDLFTEKIQSVDLKIAFPKYKGGSDHDKAIVFIRDQFFSKNSRPDTTIIYCHVTVAVNTENIKFVFNAVKDMIFSEKIKHSGVL